MNFGTFFHENKSKFAYAADMRTLHIRLLTGRSEASKVTLAVFDPYEWHKAESGTYELTEVSEIPMRVEQTTRHHDCWFAAAAVPAKRAKYVFIAENGGERYLFGPDGELPYTREDGGLRQFLSKHSHLCYIYPYIQEADLFTPPKWAENTIWYQIFPERFANSGTERLRKGTLLLWGSEDIASNAQLYGGDLPGITSRLDYIKDMGFTGIYLTPIFTSPSTHKYNTEDYFQIDPAFGDHALFGELMQEAHRRGIRVMLDLVFNHIGSTHPFWRDVEANGKASPYYDWFCVREDGSYETFANVKQMPKWNADNKEARAYLISVALYWARTYRVDGFRLDVANELSHDFWREFRAKLREVSPDIYILGEVWDNGMAWLLGDQFDAVMNYPLCRAIWKFVGADSGGAALREEIAASLTMYPRDRQKVTFNLIGSHDTSRILTLCKGSAERVMQAYALLMTMAGSPMCFYGDEAGIDGEGDGGTRKCMVWDEARRDTRLSDFVRRLNRLRAVGAEMRQIDMQWHRADKEAVIYQKSSLIVILNCRGCPAEIALPAALTGKQAQDLLHGGAFTTESSVKIGNYGLCMWKLRSPE